MKDRSKEGRKEREKRKRETIEMKIAERKERREKETIEMKY